jgi:quinol monooxygenase YgiN
MIHVIATIEVAPGTREKLLAEFAKVVPLVHAEAGCIEYGPTIDADTDLPYQHRIGPERVTIIEKWESVETLRAHGESAHMLAYRERVKDYLRGREIRILRQP